MAKPRPAADRSIDVDPRQELRKRFRDALAQKGSQAKIAGDTGVSTKTLGPILKDRLPGGHAAGSKSATQISDYQIRGLVPALVRLWRYSELSIKPDELLHAYGLPDSEITHNVLTRELQALGRPLGIDDAVTQDIQDHQLVRLGAIAWAPFLEPGESGGDQAWRSLAFRFMSALFASIYPHANFEVVELGALDEAMDALIQPTFRAHAVFGMYELPARYAKGVRFIPIPGLYATLGALVPASSKLRWRDFSDDPSMPSPVPVLIVLTEEAGHLFARAAYRASRSPGPPEGRLRVIDARLPTGPTGNSSKPMSSQQLAIRLAADLVVERASSGDNVALIVESETCARVHRALKESRDDVFKLLHEKNSSIGRDDDELFKFRLLDNDSVFTPRYPIAIALRADARHLHDLIERALHIDVFGTLLGRTAQWYIAMLKRFDRQRAKTQNGTHWYPNIRDPREERLARALFLLNDNGALDKLFADTVPEKPLNEIRNLFKSLGVTPIVGGMVVGLVDLFKQLGKEPPMPLLESLARWQEIEARLLRDERPDNEAWPAGPDAFKTRTESPR